MKRKTSILGALIISAMCLFSCNSGTPQNNVVIQQPQQQYQPQQNITVTPAANIPGGFDVQSFGGLLKQTSDPNALTQAINAQNNSINHLDLDGDGAVDYLRVDQTGDNSLVVMDEVSASQRTPICTLTVNNVNNSYNIVGSPDYCGSAYSYNSPVGLTLSQYAFLSWWFAPVHYHHYYHPGWGYHSNYGYGYHPYRPRNGLYTNREVARTRTTVKTTTTTTPTVKQTQQVQQKPAVAKNIPTVSNATTSQKQFTAGEGNRFKANSSNNVFKTTPAAARPTPSARSFGGGGKSFGGGRKR